MALWCCATAEIAANSAVPPWLKASASMASSGQIQSSGLIDTGPGEGINGGLMKRLGPAAPEGAPVNSYVVTIGVPSVDDYLKRVREAGSEAPATKGSLWISSGSIFTIAHLSEPTTAECQRKRTGRWDILSPHSQTAS